MPSTTKPITIFQNTTTRANALLDLYDRGVDLDEADDLLRAAVVLAVAGFDRYFTSKFCDVLVPHLKGDDRISQEVLDLLRRAGLDTKFALELAVSKRPFRKIRTIVQNSMSRHTTQRASVIDKLFNSFGLSELSANAQRKARRANLLTRISRLVDMRNDIAHEAHNNTRGTPKAIDLADIRSRISDMCIFVNSCWRAPIVWSGLIVSASWAFGPLERYFLVLVADSPRRCAA